MHKNENTEKDLALPEILTMSNATIAAAFKIVTAIGKKNRRIVRKNGSLEVERLRSSRKLHKKIVTADTADRIAAHDLELQGYRCIRIGIVVPYVLRWCQSIKCSSP